MLAYSNQQIILDYDLKRLTAPNQCAATALLYQELEGWLDYISTLAEIC